MIFRGEPGEEKTFKNKFLFMYKELQNAFNFSKINCRIHAILVSSIKKNLHNSKIKTHVQHF